MKKFIHLRGSMACGKTTAARQFLQRGNFALHEIEVFGKTYPLMFDRDQNIVVTGRYDTRVCGGLDGVITNRRIMFEYLLKIMKYYKPEAIVFEAVLYGMSVKFAIEVMSLGKRFGYEYVGLVLVPPFEESLNRVFERNGGKMINIESFEKNYKNAVISANSLKERGVKIKMIDTSKIKKENMYKIVEDEL